MAKQNVIDKKTQDLTIDPGASGDSYVQFDINTTGEFRIGVDDDAADSFVISQGSALGINNTLSISAAGEINLPLQPSFFAYNAVTDLNVTGDNTNYIVICDTVVWDQGSDYNNGTGVFTAPRTGKYLFNVCILLADLDAAHTSAFIQLVATSRTIRMSTSNPGIARTIGALGNLFGYSGSTLIDMNATDTAYMTIRVAEGTKTVDVYGTIAGDMHTYFTGQLIA